MLLFVNACLREGSRTLRLARKWLERRAYEGEVVELSLAKLDIEPLDAVGSNPLSDYSRSVADGEYGHSMFALAKQFAQADEILIAAPFWNYSLPAKLHVYLELVCSQGVTFDIDDVGGYVGLIQARQITYVQTAGGAKVKAADDHSFGYVRTLAQCFWHVPKMSCVSAWGLDASGADVEALLDAALAEQ